MRDKSEKYLLIAREYPNKAGKMRQLLEAQKRLIIELSKNKQSDKVTNLLITASECYDVSMDLLDWTKKVLNGVAEDASALKEGSKVRNALQFQNSIVEQYLNRDDEYLKLCQNKLKGNVTSKTDSRTA